MGRALLKLKSNDTSNQEDFELSKPVTTIGRSRSADITLQDTSVSRIHVRLEQRHGQYFVIDNNSSNGTFINRRKITDSPLRHGDVLIVGRVYFDFVEEVDEEGGRTATLPTLGADGQPMGMGGTMSVKMDKPLAAPDGLFVEPESESILELDDDEAGKATNQHPVADFEDDDSLDDTWRPPEPPPAPPVGAAAPPPPPKASAPPPPPAAPIAPAADVSKQEKAVKNHKRDSAEPKMRLLAVLIDIVASFAMYLPAVIAGVLGFGSISSLFALLAMLMVLLHYIGGWLFYGKTIGKALLNLRIVDLNAADKEGLTPETLLKRILGYVGCSIPFYLGFLFILKDPEGRGLHDKFANTIVIKED